MSIKSLTKFPTEQNDKQRFINSGISEILDGEIDILNAIAILKHVEDVISSIKSDLQVLSILSTEIEKYGKGEKPTALGYQISIGQRRNYDYSGCGDAHYEELKKKQTEFSDTIKQREKFLQALTQKIVDAENGGFEISPPICSYTTYPVLKSVKQGIELPPDNLPF